MLKARSQKKGNRSLARKMALTYFIVVLLAVGFSGFFLNRAVTASYIDTAAGGLFVQASMAANLAAENTGRERDYALSRFARQVGSRVLFLDETGRVLSDSADATDMRGKTLTHSEVTVALEGKNSAALHRLPSGQYALYAGTPITRNRRLTGAVLLSAPADNLQGDLVTFRRNLLAFSLGSALLALVVTLFIAHRLTRPLQELTVAAGDLASGNLNRRVQVTGRDELGELGRAFNSMGASLQALDETRRNFVANASHELRTPLASMKALAQSVLADPKAGPDLYREFLADVDREVDRLAQMVNHLLELTRLEKSGLITQEQVNMAELVHSVAEPMRQVAGEKGLIMEIITSGSCYVSGDDRLLAQAVRNLLENAIKYTPSGGKITLFLEEAGENARLTVKDTGLGVPREILPQLFEPFVRGDPARSRATGGFGLGLALVRQIAQAHGGDASVQTSQAGSAFSFTIPCKPFVTLL